MIWADPLDLSARAILQAMANGMWQGLALTVLVWCLLRLMPRLSATTRYAVWFVTLMGVAALPLLPLLPRLPEARASVSPAPMPRELPAPIAIPATTPSTPAIIETAITLEPGRDRPEAVPPSRPLRLTVGDGAADLLIAWGALAFLGLTRVLWSLGRLWRIKRTSIAVSPELAARVELWRASCGTTRPVRVVLSTRVSAPLLAGFRNPLIVLPAAIAGQLSQDEIDQIGMHELAHLRRGDDWTNLWQKVIQALFFYHPCVHWIGRRLNLDREIACDDWVLAARAERKSYAECLMRLIDLKRRRGPALAPGAVQGRSQIARRIETLLDRKRNAAPRVSLAALVFSAALVGLALLQATGAAPLVTMVAPAHEPDEAALASQVQSRHEEAEQRREERRQHEAERREAAQESLRQQAEARRQASEIRRLQQQEEQSAERQGLDARRGQQRAAAMQLLAENNEQATEQQRRVDEDRRRMADEARREAEAVRRHAAEEQQKIAEERRRMNEENRRHTEEVQREAQERRREEQELRRHEQDERRRSGEHRHWTQSSGFWYKFSAETRGQIEFTDDDRDVKSLSPDAYLRIQERRGLNTRSLEFSFGVDGSLVRIYRIGMEQRPIEEARAWMAETLPEMIREMAVGADARVKRILKKRGPGGVLEEIEKIHSDGSKRIYFEELFANGPLDAANLRQAMRQITRQIGSDGEKRRVLESVADSYLKDASLRLSYFDGIDSIGSDGERRRVLTTVLTAYAGRDISTQIAKSAGRIGSDGEKARVLASLIENTKLDPGSTTAYFRAVGSIGSSGEQRRVLSAALRKAGQSQDVALQALRTASSISSDGEKAALLVEAADVVPSDPAVLAAFVETASTISSDGEKRRALSALLARKDLPKPVLAEAAKAVGSIGSDGEKARVLIELIASRRLDPEMRPRFFEAVDSISSDGERRRVLSTVVRSAPADKELLLGVLKSARGISSDGEKGRLLVEVAAVCPPDDAVIGAFLETVRGISSDGEYRRAVSALSNREDIRGKVKVIL